MHIIFKGAYCISLAPLLVCHKSYYIIEVGSLYKDSADTYIYW